MDIDFSELRELSSDLSSAHRAVNPHVARATERTAYDVKRALVAEIRRSRHFRGFAPAVSYDMRYTGGEAGEIMAEIGPERGKPGSLANIAYFGTSRGGGTVEEPGVTLQEYADQYTSYMEDLLQRFTL